LSIILDIFMIPAWKLEGAAIASSIAYVTAFLVTLFYYCRITGLRPKELLLLRRDDMKQIRAWTTKGMTYLWRESEIRSA
jgi:Na+-driven multidrug efflux pump